VIRGLLTALIAFVVLFLVLGLLGSVGPVELGLVLLLAIVAGWIARRRALGSASADGRR
jgi:hypothetical protein